MESDKYLNKKQLYVIGILIVISLVIIGFIVSPTIILLPTLLMTGISLFGIRDILKKYGYDPNLLSETNKIKFDDITRSKLPLCILIPISIPLLLLYSEFAPRNEWFLPFWFVIAFIIFLTINALIYVYYFKYLLKKEKNYEN